MIIGLKQDEPKACGDEHFPGCFNSDFDQTWCLCGEVKWPGNTGVWISRRLYSSAGRDAVLLGYDIYFLPPIGGVS